MANISEEKWIEMLEKKADGNYIAKYPKVKSKSGVTFDEHLADIASQEAGKGASMIGVQDANNRFTGTNVEAVLNELFTFANDGKTGIASVIGSPATSGDTFTTLESRIQTNKNTLAINLTNKGQIASGTDTLANLVAKVANIDTGSKIAFGDLTIAQNGADVVIDTHSLSFTPRVILYIAQVTSLSTYYLTLLYDVNDILKTIDMSGALLSHNCHLKGNSADYVSGKGYPQYGTYSPSLFSVISNKYRYTLANLGSNFNPTHSYGKYLAVE